MAGKIILVNGASRSGKSTLCRALQAKLDEPFWHFSIDHLRDAGVLPNLRIRNGEFPSTFLLDETVDTVISAWNARQRPSAFDRMAAR